MQKKIELVEKVEKNGFVCTNNWKWFILDLGFKTVRELP